MIGSAVFPGFSFANDSPEITEKRYSTRYNNYFEFSSNKEAIVHLARELTTSPWSIKFFSGNQKIGELAVGDLQQFQQHRRVYRFRCVEGWSMVIPWRGVLLSDVIKSINPLGSGKFVKFTALHRPSEMIGQRRETLPWPYVEGLRMDEATHPLTLLATGMYDESLPNQNGGPVRLIAPWKYGFKSIKAVEKIEFVDEQPTSSWSQVSPDEYGFYANVNPEVAHPRWSQRRELPLGKIKKIKTLPFNGYADQVAHLYEGMDLEKFY